jgi:predicted alpha/beta-fold hydrolase
MAEITPSRLSEMAADSSAFRPLRGGSNPHFQTMLPRLIRRKLGFTPTWQRLELPDGDFVDLAWSEDPALARHKPRLVVFHGLEGSLHSPYAHGLIEAAKARGWLGVVMHFRGCSGEPNRLNRIYHSGETEDGTWFLHWLQREFGRSLPRRWAIRWAAICWPACWRKRKIASPGCCGHCLCPFVLEACSAHIETGFSRVYQHYLLNLLKANASRKLKAYPGSLPIDLRQLKRLRRLRDFDDAITARIHGFADAIDYYRQCSAMPLLNKISKPTLIIHAKDDPFMDQNVIPDTQTLPPSVEYQLTEHGGHVGFVGGTLLHPEMWLEKRIPDWLQTYLES